MEVLKTDDLISSLPFEIQKRVLSSLPLKEAIRTSCLSSFWRSLWSPIHLSLDFDLNHEGSNQEIEKVIGMFLKSFSCPEILALNLKVLDGGKDELVIKATKGVKQELHVEFFDSETQNITAKNCWLCLHSNPTQKASFLGVKLLHLRSISNLSKPLVSMLFANCNVLESLRLEKCRGLESLEVETFTLQRLLLEDCSDMAAIVVNAPNLRSFEYHGALPQIKIEKAVSLVHVVLDLRDGPGRNEFDCEDVLPSLACFQDVEILTISGWLLEWLCVAGVIFGKLEFNFNKLKELSCTDSIISKDKTNSLACFLNSCPSLIKLSVKIERTQNLIQCPCSHQYWHEPHLWMDFETVKSSTSDLEKLRSVDLVGFVGKEDELLLIELLLEKATRLNSFFIM